MTAPLPPGLEQAIAAMQALRERQVAKRAAPPPRPAPVRRPGRTFGLPVQPRVWPKMGTERTNRPISVGQAVRVWWNWD